MKHRVFQMILGACMLINSIGTTSVSALKPLLPPDIYQVYFRSEIVSRSTFGLLCLMLIGLDLLYVKHEKKADYFICGILAIIYVGDMVRTFFM